jgi:hypothetical protein
MALLTSLSPNIERMGTKCAEFAITSYTEDLTLASNEAGAANVAAVLGTLIFQLIQKGIITGTVNS